MSQTTPRQPRAPDVCESLAVAATVVTLARCPGVGPPSFVRSLHPQVAEDEKASFGAIAPICFDPPAAWNHDHSHSLKAHDIDAVDLTAVDEDSGARAARGVWSERSAAERRARRKETAARPSDRTVCSADAVVPV